MPEDTATAKPMTAIPLTAARLSFVAAATFLVLLAALHFIKPEFDPSWRVISEYALGDYGWMMALAFLSLAVSCVGLFVAIRSQTRTIGGKIGLAFLLVAAAGLIIAAIFTTDPITASQDELTAHGNLHGLGAALGTGFPIAATLIGWSLARNQAWFPARRSLLWSAGLDWLSGVLLVYGYHVPGRRYIRSGRVDRVAQPVHDRSLQRVADGSSLARGPVEQAKIIAEEG